MSWADSSVLSRVTIRWKALLLHSLDWGTEKSAYNWETTIIKKYKNERLLHLALKYNISVKDLKK